MAECPNCREEFQRLGMHWWHGTCPYPELDQVTREMLTGLLMGDGSVPRSAYNSIFRLPMINRRFLEWFDGEVGILTTGVSLKKTAAELADNNRRTGFSPNARTENYHDMYSVWTRPHPFIETLREWYATGRKRFPTDLELTPTITTFWYLCDGYLDIDEWNSPRIEIKNRTEKDRKSYLTSLFRRQGFDPVYRRSELVFGRSDTERLVDWMGPPPPGFEYKWAIDSIVRYRKLKRRAYTEYTTQTFENRNT